MKQGGQGGAYAPQAASPRGEKAAAHSPGSRAELLAPAGNWECVFAAVANGADAVYFGLDKFNARMRADNFLLADMPELVEWLHERHVRAYVTMNVLVFPREMEEAVAYLSALDAAGVDGVIVQDMGLAALISRQKRAGRWRLELHISTQMTVCDPEAVRLVDELYDPEQIVLARELSLPEIEACAQATSKHIEVFCHGALCVAYSGQCLTSESLGCRSANRGECAQACRLPYKLELDGRRVQLGERRYLFSPQDLCSLELVPQMLKAGVHSFKIEGRLKAPEYVAAVTRAYRRALDAAMAGRALAHVAEDLYAMQMAFSRGFCTGWLKADAHHLVTHGRYGKKRGVYVGRVGYCEPGLVELESEPAAPLAPGDGLVFDAGQDRNEEQGGSIWKVSGRTLYFHGKAGHIEWSFVRPGQLVWKTADPALQKRLRATWAGMNKAVDKPLDIRVEGRAGEPLRLSCGEVQVQSELLLAPAMSRPLTEEVLCAQLGRLGGTGYKLRHIENAVETGVMLPVSALNQLRRDLVARLPHPEQAKPADEPCSFGAPSLASFPRPERCRAPQLHVLCREAAQVHAAAEAGVSRIYLDIKDTTFFQHEYPKCLAAYPRTQFWLATLRIMKPREGGFIKKLMAMNPAGILVRNLGAVQMLRKSGIPMVGDFSLNAANAESVQLWRSMGLQAVSVSYDLNAHQLNDLLSCGCGPYLELTLHQHMPLFHSQHCVFRTFLSEGTGPENCNKMCRHRVRVVDRVHAAHYLRSDMACRNTLFNARAQTAARCVAEALRAGLPFYRLELLEEDSNQTVELIRLYSRLLRGECGADFLVQRLGVLDRPGITEIEH